MQCMLHWGALSQALAPTPVSAVVETAVSSCSPEKNAARSQQLFLPGRQLPGGTSPSPTVCLPSLTQGLLVLCPCVLQGTLSPLRCGCCQPPHCPVPFLAQKGPGLSMVPLGVSRMPCVQVRCRVSPGRLLTKPPGWGQALLLFQTGGCGRSMAPRSFGRGDQAWPFLTHHGRWAGLVGC